MVFQEVVEQGQYDLVIADESWDVDHFWHEHLEPSAARLLGSRISLAIFRCRKAVTARRISPRTTTQKCSEHIERYPRVRDRAILLATPMTSSVEHLDPGCRRSEAGPKGTFEFSGYITGHRSDRYRRPRRASPGSAASDMAKTKKCASSPSVDQPLAVRCFGASSTRQQRFARCCQKCASWSSRAHESIRRVCHALAVLSFTAMSRTCIFGSLRAISPWCRAV